MITAGFYLGSGKRPIGTKVVVLLPEHDGHKERGHTCESCDEDKRIGFCIAVRDLLDARLGAHCERVQ